MTNKFITAIYDVSLPCNYRCVYCRNDWSLPDSCKHTNFEQIKVILKAFKDNNFSRVIFTGGEFFIIPFWEDIITYTSKLGLEIWIITNGYSIRDDDMIFLRKFVKKINVSFHAHNSKLYNKIMNPPTKDAFNIVLRNMKLINENNIELGIFFSPIKSNVDFLYETIKRIKTCGIKINSVNINRIVKTQSTENFLKREHQLNLFEHKNLILQAYKILKELHVKTTLEAYPYCFLKEILDSDKIRTLLNQPCFLGRNALAFNTDGTMKLCPATHFSISKPIYIETNLLKNKQINKFNSNTCRNKSCINCIYWNQCFGGCHAVSGKLFSDDPLLIDDKIDFIENIDDNFFDILISLYKPFLSSSYRKADIKYTLLSKKYRYPIGIIALNKTRSKGNFLELALIPKARNTFYSFLAINKFLQLHPLNKIGWTVHKANLPSIKLLQKLNGGFFENTVKNKKRIEAEGFFRYKGKAPKKMREALTYLISDSTEKFNNWLNNYRLRKDIIKELNKYLERYSNENN